jgi:hypothetical protein
MTPSARRPPLDSAISANLPPDQTMEQGWLPAPTASRLRTDHRQSRAGSTVDAGDASPSGTTVTRSRRDPATGTNRSHSYCRRPPVPVRPAFSLRPRRDEVVPGAPPPLPVPGLPDTPPLPPGLRGGGLSPGGLVPPGGLPPGGFPPGGLGGRNGSWPGPGGLGRGSPGLGAVPPPGGGGGGVWARPPAGASRAENKRATSVRFMRERVASPGPPRLRHDERPRPTATSPRHRSGG